MQGGLKKRAFYKRGCLMAVVSSGVWALSSRVRWAYVNQRWVLVWARHCAAPGCRFEAFQEQEHCIRHRLRPAPPAPSLRQLSLWC